MANDLRRYYARIREIEASLLAAGNKWPLIMSLEDDSRGWHGGVVTEVSAYDAGKMITEGSHRLATKEEIAKYKADLEERRAAGKKKAIDSGAALIIESLSRSGVTQTINPHLVQPAIHIPPPEAKKPKGDDK